MENFEESKYIVHGPKLLRDIPNESFGRTIYSHLQEHINLPIALIDGVTQKTISYSRIAERSLRLAYSLQKIGVTKFDVIAISSENSPNYFYPLFAGLYVGATITTFSPYYTSGEVMHAANISKPKIIFCSKMSLKPILQVLKELEFVKKIIVIDDYSSKASAESVDDFVRMNSYDYSYFEPADVDGKDIALILYSSGTTGLPKGVMLTHRNLNAIFTIFRDKRYYVQVEPGTAMSLGLLPFFHAYGLTILLTCVLYGKSLIVMPKFEANSFLKTVQDFKIKSLAIVPPIANFLANDALVDKYDLSHVEAIACGAAPLSKETEKKLLHRFKKIASLRQGYGLTEVTVAVLGFPVGVGKPGSCGKVLPETSAKVVDVVTGKVLGPNKIGELYFKGPQIMKGYIGDIKSTNSTLDVNGWLRTGDVGYYDEEDFFYIVDRLKELIKYKGFQVAPAELESILLGHPKITDAAVIGLQDEKAGEVPLAFVVKCPNQRLTEDDVKNFVAEQVAPYKLLRGGVKFVTEIPKSASGKILRRQLRETLKQRSKL